MRTLMTIVAALLSCAALLDAQENPVYTKHPDFVVKTDTSKEPVCEGAFTPDVESLSAYECPEWFRDAKFGIWAHWGPQCQPEDGDWYARKMYISSDQAYKYQLDTKGHPSEYGFKDWLPDWKADKFEPDSLATFTPVNLAGSIIVVLLLLVAMAMPIVKPLLQERKKSKKQSK